MRIVTDSRVMKFIDDFAGTRLQRPCTALGIERNGKIIAGVVFNNYTKNDVEVTVAGNGFTRAFIHRVGQYVFDELGCLRLTVTTEQERVVKITHRLGGQTEGRKRNHFGAGRDAVVLGILREDWKF